MVKRIRKKKEGKIDFEKEKRKDKNTIIVIAIIAGSVAALVLASYSFIHANNDSGKFSVIDGLTCDKVSATNHETHAHLDIFVNQTARQVPAEIGVVNNTCKYGIYTSDNSGIIHIGLSENQQFSLSQFFDIWKATSTFPPTGTPSIYVNGERTTSGMNDTKVNPDDEIAIIYGSKPAIIPSSYQFPTPP